MGTTREILEIFGVERDDGVNPSELRRIPLPLR
jgi:hypothetical protein